MLPFIVAIIRAFGGGRRACPKCGWRQSCAIEDQRMTVRCQRCGASIPPGRPRGSQPGERD